MLTTDNRYILKPENVDDNVVSIRQNFILLGNFYRKINNNDYETLLKHLNQKEQILFINTLYNLFNLYSKKTNGIIFDMFEVGEGFMLNFEQFYKDCARYKNDESILNIIYKQFSEATRKCYEQNADTLSGFKINTPHQYPALVETMYSRPNAENNNYKDVISYTVGCYNNYKCLKRENEK